MVRDRPDSMSLAASLEPVRAALLAAAREEAAQILAGAEEEARRRLTEAQEEAERIRADARARGTADAGELIAARRAQAGRQARALVLAAQRGGYEALREAARTAVGTLVDEPGYPLVRRRMLAALTGLTGRDAQVHDAPGGGVVAVAPGLVADLSLARLADRAVDAVLADDLDDDLDDERAADSAGDPVAEAPQPEEVAG